MSFGFLGTLSRSPGFGFGWSNELTNSSVYTGVSQVEVAGGGCINVIWPTESTAVLFNVYIQASTATGLFVDANRVGKYPNLTSRALIRTEGDNQTLLQSTKKYHIGVRFESLLFGEDHNVVTLSVKPLGGEPVFVNDRHVGTAL